MVLTINDNLSDFAARFGLFADGDAGGGGAGAGVITDGQDQGAGTDGQGAGTGDQGQQQTPARTSTRITQEQLDAAINKALDPYKTEISNLKSTNIILQGMVRDASGNRQQPAAQQQAPAKPALPDKDKFIEDMNNDPVGTILGLINNHVKPEFDGKLDSAKQETRQEQQYRQQLETAISGDQTAALALANQWDEGTAERDLFDKYGEEELEKICPATIINGKKMPDPRIFRPGMLEQAALKAERRLRIEGKGPAASKPNGNGNGANGSRQVLQFPRATRSSSGAPSGNELTVPKSIDDLVTMGKLTSSDAAAAKSNCKKWNMTEDRFVASWIESEKDNPNYGSGL